MTIFGEALATAGFPNHAIVDTARNGVQGLRDAWGDWCNVIGAGIGVRPTADTGEELADAFVWVKPAGESDGTSDSSATRYDSMCGLDDGERSSLLGLVEDVDANFYSLQAISGGWRVEPAVLRGAPQERQPVFGLKCVAHS